jgi:hypothetical protein
MFLNVLWHVVPSLGNDCELCNKLTAAVKKCLNRDDVGIQIDTIPKLAQQERKCVFSAICAEKKLK